MKHEGVILAVDGASARVAVIPPQYASCKADPAEVPSREMSAEIAPELVDLLEPGARVEVSTTARSTAAALLRVLVIPSLLAWAAWQLAGPAGAIAAAATALGLTVYRGNASVDRPRVVGVLLSTAPLSGS